MAVLMIVFALTAVTLALLVDLLLEPTDRFPQ